MNKSSGVFGCCVFQVLAAPESWSNYFFQPFSTFFVDFKPFSVISRLKSTKNIWKWTKNICSSKLVEKQKLVDSLSGYLEFVFFWLYNRMTYKDTSIDDHTTGILKLFLNVSIDYLCQGDCSIDCNSKSKPRARKLCL